MEFYITSCEKYQPDL